MNRNLMRQKYFIESRFRMGRKGGWTEWVLLDPRQMLDDCALSSLQDVRAYEQMLDADDELGEWAVQIRARMHPKFGSKTFLLHGPVDIEPEPQCTLSRGMPPEVHALNDAVLSALGV